MQIMVAKRAGVCFGVKRALDITFKLAKEGKEGLYTLGPLIHNPQVIKKLIAEGVVPIEDVHNPAIRTLVVRTHGIPPSVYAEISKMSYNLVDATCPFVKKAQQYAQVLKEEGYQVLIVGDKEHPEVQALLGFAGDDVIVINSAGNNGNNSYSIPPLKNKIGIIAQTTQPVEALESVFRHVIARAKEVKVYNTICDSTALRLEETKELAMSVDTMIVVGGKNSANTTQLTNLSKGICAKVYHIETADELIDDWFTGSEKIGITGGASTPQWIIDEATEKIREISLRR
ncbi:MAG: 4-hydroxy-3-methylbut-2-enyl diphosphate reductase [Nitrospirae bacterium]|nr:4-hydroxy-3-methylbut-2-enyl diphosphate reductase [Nitrospirota bacterium]